MGIFHTYREEGNCEIKQRRDISRQEILNVTQNVGGIVHCSQSVEAEKKEVETHLIANPASQRDHKRNGSPDQSLYASRWLGEGKRKGAH
jgi:hypothetical protein